MAESESGKCSICGIQGGIYRTYFYYGIKCECHSPEHFDIVFTCKDCVPKEPTTTTLQIKPSVLKQLK